MKHKIKNYKIGFQFPTILARIQLEIPNTIIKWNICQYDLLQRPP